MIKLFSVNNYTQEWLTELAKTFESGQIGQGPRTAEFEHDFSVKFNCAFAVGVNSGTAALELAYHLADIQPGDRVLVPVLTCTATNLPLVHRGARIEFVDILRDTLTMSFSDFKQKANKEKPKAVVTVNLGGLRCDERIYEYCNQHKIPVIVDACQSLGIDEPAGDYVCYSFQAIKHFTAGDAGMLVVRTAAAHARAKKLRWFGIDKEKREKLNFNFSPSNREICMNMDEPGFKLHMNDIQATMGLVGLKHSDNALLHRIVITNTYRRHLVNKIPVIDGGSEWLFCVLLEDRDKGKMDKLKSVGIECDLVHLRNDIFTPFGSKRQDLPNMNYVESRYLYLPLHTNMDYADATFISKELIKLI